MAESVEKSPVFEAVGAHVEAVVGATVEAAVEAAAEEVAEDGGETARSPPLKKQKLQEEAIQKVKAVEKAPVRVLGEANPAVNGTTNEVESLLKTLGCSNLWAVFQEQEVNTLGNPPPRKPPPPSILISRACSWTCLA